MNLIVAVAVLCAFDGKLSTAQSGDSPFQSPSNGTRQVIVAAKHRLVALKVELQERLERYEELKDRYSRVRKESIEIGATPESFPEILKSLQTQKIQLLIDIAGLDVRFESLRQMAMEDAAKNNAVEGEEFFVRLADVQKQRLDDARGLKENGSMSLDEYRRVEIDYLNARLQLSNVQKPAKKVGPMNNAMMEVGLDRAEKKARLEKVESLLAQMTSASNVLEENVDLQRKVERFRGQVAQLETEIRVTETALVRATRELEALGKDETID